MEDKNPQGMKVPLIVIGVAIAVIAAGMLVRSLKTPPSPAAPETEPASALAPEPAPMPMPATPTEPGEQIQFSSLAATDNDGSRWTLGLKGVPSQLPEDGTKPGAPLVVKADVMGSSRNISIGLIIEGQAGEVYEPGAAKNGRRMPAPTFKVFDESGTVVGSGSFEYG